MEILILNEAAELTEGGKGNKMEDNHPRLQPKR